eukprot:GILK01008110.1.p1 GENE.GILK01008110.1~~GILK01008110.1.p1  ORF type:complete len:157 (-),score=25.95 GILK01008110.1:109-525(-)
MEDDLRAVREDFANGRMRAFGDREKVILDTVERIRKEQTEMFLQHMNLEISFPTIDTDQHTAESGNFCKKVQMAFEQRQQEVNQLVHKLHNLSDLMESMDTLSERDHSKPHPAMSSTPYNSNDYYQEPSVPNSKTTSK